MGTDTPTTQPQNNNYPFHIRKRTAKSKSSTPSLDAYIADAEAKLITYQADKYRYLLLELAEAIREDLRNVR